MKERMAQDHLSREHLSKDAVELLTVAEKKAATMGHGFVGAEHVMLAFFETNRDLAGLVIDEYIGTYDKLNHKVMEAIKDKTYGPEEGEELLRKAHREANLSFSSVVDVPHIITAIFNQYTRQESIPVQVLQSFGVNIDWFVKLVRFPRSVKKEAPQKTMTTGSAISVLNNQAFSGTRSPLEKYGRDITVMAQNHMLDPVALREKEIDDIIEILCRRVKSNPLLIGEPGVGKSALMTGLAQRIIAGAVPEKLKQARIFELNLTSVISGASLQGEFEKRMTGIINAVSQDPNIILFIDEIHSIVGTGGVPGMGDAANILKAPLINGDIRCIGATTGKEYRKYIERDPALARRFQTIEIREPSAEETVEIIKSIKHLYEEFHQVTLPDKVIKNAVELSVLHIKDQFLPDKAIDLIDQACAHVSLTRTDNGDRVVVLEDVAVVLSHKTKIPLDKLTTDKMEKLLHLEELLGQRIVGQDEAIDKVCDIIRMTKSSLDLKPVRPDGVFLFIGPTGVGKTEMARVLAEILFDDEGKMIRLDMSEYMEPHSVAKIIGSPPGYIGSDQEGGLTGRVRTEPYSIILLDEVEKAHPDVLNIFLQVFEDGRLTDSQGRTVYFSNATVIMTSNIGASVAFNRKREIGFNESAGDIDFEATEKILRESARKFFSPEFINRIDEIVYFKPLDKKSIESIASMKLEEIRKRFSAEHKEIYFAQDVLSLISELGYKPEYGARFLNRTIENMILKPLSRKLLSDSEENRFYITAEKNNEICIKGGVNLNSDKH